MKHTTTFVILLLIVFLMGSCSSDKETITVFHAGSLSVPLSEIAREFESLHPGVTIQMESAGSLTCIRKITELNKPCDILAVADYSLIDELMIPDYAEYNILFAGNELAIGFLKESKWEEVLTPENWTNMIMRDDVHFGRSDPNHDPSGYRSVITMGLAGAMNGDSSLLRRFLEKDTKYIRPKGTEILPLLEVGAIDLVFHYRSVLVQHNLGFMPLPDSLNLSNPNLDSWYATSCIDVAGTDAGHKIAKCGEAMVYGICKPLSAKSQYADEFLQFIVTKGTKILENNGQPVVTPQLSEKSIKKPDWF